jgi:acetate---CoA ligase (ADP-forming) subunit beta
MLKQETLLNEVEAKDLLRKAGIPVIDTRLGRDKNEAISLSREIGFPVAMKIISGDIVHKSDVGGVKLGLADAVQVGKAYDEMMNGVRQKLPAARIIGVSIQKMAPPGVEVIIGMTRDAQFGPVIMFGLGGIMVEVLKDVSFRIVPLTRWDAAEMISEIKGHAILRGFRGQPPVSITALEDLVLKISDFIAQNPQVKELDLNPVIAYPDSALAVDARIVIDFKP